MNDHTPPPTNIPAVPPEPALPPPVAPSAASAWRNPWPIIAVIALLLAGWQWMETRLRMAETQQELARRLAESDAAEIGRASCRERV